ncbi:MAG: hypothetical protein HFH32_04205 [Eubacterium sp.]|nr:hypothetical protein [Eubacterium sp.]
MERQAAGSALPVFSVIRRCGKNPLASAAVRAVRKPAIYGIRLDFQGYWSWSER